MSATIKWWNNMAAISWESLAPVIALHGRRGNARPYYTSNRYYYHANTVSTLYLHIQRVPCVQLWCTRCSSLHIYYEQRAALVPNSFKVTISLSIIEESNSIWVTLMAKDNLISNLDLKCIQYCSLWWLSPAVAWKCWLSRADVPSMCFVLSAN